MLITNFTVGAIDAEWKFVVDLGSLNDLDRFMADGSEERGQFQFAQYISVGRYILNECRDLRRAGDGAWGLGQGSTRNSLVVVLNVDATRRNGGRQWITGETVCVQRTVLWEWPETQSLFGSSFEIAEHVHPTEATSRIRRTPNRIPRRPLVAAPLLDGFADVEGVNTETFEGDPELDTFDPNETDIPEIVLPDFVADDEADDDTEALLGTIPDDVAFDVNDVRISLTDFRNQFRSLADLLGITGDQGGNNSASPNPGSLQQDAFLAAARNPQVVADAITRARSSLAKVQNAIGQGGSGSGADGGGADSNLAPIANQVNEDQARLTSLAAAAPVSVAGGIVSSDKIGSLMGFNPAQSPVAGLTGSGSVVGLTMKVQGPKAVKRGKKATVRVTVNPSNTKGIVRLVILRKTRGGLQVVSARQVKLNKGRATTTMRVAEATGKGAYTLTATLVPNSRTGSGITVQRPIRVS